MKKFILGTTLCAVLACAGAAQTATPTLYGALSNFDVYNDNPVEACGFEIEIQGILPSDVMYTFGGTYNRYGTPQVVPAPTGVYVRYMSSYDAANHKFRSCTPVPTVKTPTNGHICFNGGMNPAAYQSSGCEHFGVSLRVNPVRTIYRWMLPNAAAPGTLIANSVPVAIPAPVWTVQPPVRPADPPVVAADFDAPAPPRNKEYGEAQWVKVYKNEHKRQINLEELLSDNPIVPRADADLEVSWDLVQSRIGGNGNRNHRQNRGSLGNGSRAVVRRYEFYKYTGRVDALTGEALCADLTCDVPAEGEVGDYIGVQMAGANLNVPDQAAVSVTVNGSGEVRTSIGGIRCPGTCTATLLPGTSITFSASPKSSVFSGWGGACNGNALNCTITANGPVNVTANFATQRRLSVSTNGKGAVTSNPAGIGCGSGGGCSGSFADGASITLTAAPQNGAPFMGWTGACTGAGLSCTFTIRADSSVTANFR